MSEYLGLIGNYCALQSTNTLSREVLTDKVKVLRPSQPIRLCRAGQGT